MPASGDPFAALERELITFYGRTEARLYRVMQGLGVSAYEQRRLELVLQQINSLVAALEEHQRGWCRRALPRAYQHGLALTSQSFRMPVLPTMTLLDRESIEVLIRRTMATTGEALASVAPFARRVWVDTQQRLVAERTLAGLIAEGRIEGLGAKELGQRIALTLRDGASRRLAGHVSANLRADLVRAARGEVIAVTGKDGVLRHYGMRYYGEMVARTATRFASTEGAIQRTLAYGGDLVQISVHGSPCDICLPVQGKVFSLTGRTPGFEVLDDFDRPPLHPHCKHVLLGVSEGWLEQEGLLGRMREVSTREQPIANLADYRELITA